MIFAICQLGEQQRGQDPRRSDVFLEARQGRRAMRVSPMMLLIPCAKEQENNTCNHFFFQTARYS